jgi:hypothetical protein
MGRGTTRSNSAVAARRETMACSMALRIGPTSGLIDYPRGKGWIGHIDAVSKLSY